MTVPVRHRALGAQLAVPVSLVLVAGSAYLLLMASGRVLPGSGFAALTSFYLLSNTVGRGTFAVLEARTHPQCAPQPGPRREHRGPGPRRRPRRPRAPRGRVRAAGGRRGGRRPRGEQVGRTAPAPGHRTHAGGVLVGPRPPRRGPAVRDLRRHPRRRVRGLPARRRGAAHRAGRHPHHLDRRPRARAARRGPHRPHEPPDPDLGVARAPPRSRRGRRPGRAPHARRGVVALPVLAGGVEPRSRARDRPHRRRRPGGGLRRLRSCCAPR